jgi:PKD repeat protein
MKKLLYIFIATLIFASCDPEQAKDIDLGPLPPSPTFIVEADPGNANRVIVKDQSTGYFSRLWVVEGGTPAQSSKEIDTIFFSKAGTYDISLYASKEGGSGTAFATKQVVIENDATVACDPKISLLTGGCEAAGKCWKFSTVAGAISVGPTFGSGDWYRSPVNGLVPEQKASSWCFKFEDFEFDFRNNGVTISPWAGYVAVPHTPTAGPWAFSPGTGQNGLDQIILTPGQFMGTWDSSHELHIALLTEDQLVVRARIVSQTGVPAAEGWFEFYFVAE